MGWQYIVPYAYEILIVSFAFSYSGYFSGLGYTNISMIAHLLSTFAVRIPVALIWGTRVGATLYDVVISAPISSFVQFMILFIFMRTGKWKIRKLEFERAA